MMVLDRALLALDGLSVGDAFGERFFSGRAIRMLAANVREVPSERSWKWTDDTAMAVSIVEEVRERGSIDRDSLALRLPAVTKPSRRVAMALLRTRS